MLMVVVEVLGRRPGEAYIHRSNSPPSHQSRHRQTQRTSRPIRPSQGPDSISNVIALKKKKKESRSKLVAGQGPRSQSVARALPSAAAILETEGPMSKKDKAGSRGLRWRASIHAPRAVWGKKEETSTNSDRTQQLYMHTSWRFEIEEPQLGRKTEGLDPELQTPPPGHFSNDDRGARPGTASGCWPIGAQVGPRA
jgi:hypothetical protein